jgi:hypothetical protein
MASVTGNRLLVPTTQQLQILELMLIASVTGKLLLFPTTHLLRIWS